MTTLRATWEALKAMFSEGPDLIADALDRWAERHKGAQ